MTAAAEEYHHSLLPIAAYILNLPPFPANLTSN